MFIPSFFIFLIIFAVFMLVTHLTSQRCILCNRCIPTSKTKLTCDRDECVQVFKIFDDEFNKMIKKDSNQLKELSKHDK